MIGTVNPRGTSTRYRLDWGTGTNLNRHTPYVTAGSANAAIPISASLTLVPNTRYSYRVVATSSAGTANGARRTFTSPHERRPRLAAAPAPRCSGASAGAS